MDRSRSHFFALLGPTVSYLLPLATLVAVLLAYAIREEHASFALGGAAIGQLAVNLAFVIATQSASLDHVRTIQWLHWNSLGGWRLCRRVVSFVALDDSAKC